MQQKSNSAPGKASAAARYAVIIANPASHRFARGIEELHETVQFLQQHGWQAELRLTQAADDARRFTREAVEQKAAMVVAVGGDGTIHCVIQELAGTETALAVLPAGTFNVWAKETGIPLDIAQARDVLLNGKVQRIDLGYVQKYNHYFLLMAGIGFGGEVTYEVKKDSLKWLGVPGYILTGIRLGLGFESFPVELLIDGRVEKTRALQIVVGNTKLYGSLLQFTWRAKCDDGLLDLCVVRRPGRLHRLVVMWDFLWQLPRRRKWITYTTCKTVEVRTRRPIAFQVDGEPIGHTPATFTIAPAALNVIVPQESPEGLFSHPPVAEMRTQNAGV
jgi:YegS/Rv2252/BmrU family lipid kinase